MIAQNVILSANDNDLLERVDFLRLDAQRRQDKGRQATLGQFLTPASVARLMASMLACQSPDIRILDAGAGIGSLFAGCVEILCARDSRPRSISVTAYEIDETLIDYLQDTFSICKSVCERVGIDFVGVIHQQDFIAASVEMLQDTLFSSGYKKPVFNCAILNPPYRKIQTKSEERKLLQKLGIEASNMYTGFLALASQLLEPAGELVTITPRSFCNGPYFKHFRQNFLQSMSLRRLHIFDSRHNAFSDDAVLQENIIMSAVKVSDKPKNVTISSSIGSDDDLIRLHEVSYDQVIHPHDLQLFIHIVQDELSQHIVRNLDAFQTSLDELKITVSTGKVVDFRALDFLRSDPEFNTIPLLFPTHVAYGSVTWPKLDGKKPNALVDAEATKVLQVPNEYYVLVKRFSSKEEKKRIVAAVYDPGSMPGLCVGFENHLNYFHQHGRGLSPLLAKGLAAYLNSTLIDTYFRQFNGHTQVNATDLRNIRYPKLDQLEALGRRIPSTFPTQNQLDVLVKEELFIMSDIDASENRESISIEVQQK